jgi:hypothetical protein
MAAPGNKRLDCTPVPSPHGDRRASARISGRLGSASKLPVRPHATHCLPCFPARVLDRPVRFAFRPDSRLQDRHNARVPDRFFGYTTSQDGRWTGGPSIEARLPGRFSIVFDALYRVDRSVSHFALSTSPQTNVILSTSSVKSQAWDFPLQLKYRLPAFRGATPFVSGGYQWSRVESEVFGFNLCSGSQGSCRPPDTPPSLLQSYGNKDSHIKRRGVAGAGLEFKTNYVTITPEVRAGRGITAMVAFSWGGGK